MESSSCTGTRSPYQDQQYGGDVPLAIVGLSFKFPQDINSEDNFWQVLCDGRSTSTDFPATRLNIDAFHHADGSRISTLPFRGGHFINEDLGAFDAPFFSITASEAACMDPQHRKLLETAYHALENAGIPISECSGSDAAVYTGCFTMDYLHLLNHDFEAEQRHAALGIAYAMLANRLSWFFNFKGPSMNVDTACSSSLVALHLACQDLRNRSTSMALVGGTNLIYHPDFLKMMANCNFLSPDSRSWSFDERANGYARGEGIAALIIKRLDDAVRDGNTIRAVIRATGTGQDGRTPGITQPSQEAQTQLIEETFRTSCLDLGSTRYFEAHGTGTAVGDPIEANAIAKAFEPSHSKENPLYIGAVKANIGHLEGASGIAAVIKAILVLEKGCIPPIAGLEVVNHRIGLGDSHIRFPTHMVQWPTQGVRRACVSSFGFGGTNAIAILDDAFSYLNSKNIRAFHRVVRTTTHVQDTSKYLNSDDATNGHDFQTTDAPRLLVWSAADKLTTSKLGDALNSVVTCDASHLDDLTYTLAARRSHLLWRSFKVVRPQKEASTALMIQRPIKSFEASGVAFIFTGQGAQYLGMGRGLCTFPAFRQSLNALDECLSNLGCKWSLLKLFEAGDGMKSIDLPEYSQTTTTCLQIALTDYLKSLNVTPSVVLGHSSGEVAAAYASGALCRMSAVKVAYWRGILSSVVAETAPDLSMTAIGASREVISGYLKRLMELEGRVEVYIGCINSPKNFTLSGKTRQLSIIEKWCDEDSIFARRLQIPIAYHSPFMLSIAERYRSAIGQTFRGHQHSGVVMLSSVTGDVAVPDDVCHADYWVRNLTSTVDFEAAFSKLQLLSNRSSRAKLVRKANTRNRIRLALEVGPHTALRSSIRDCLQNLGNTDTITYIGSLNRDLAPTESILQAIGLLHSHGYSINLLAANNLSELPRPTLKQTPPYPFNHTNSYWKESRLSKNFRFRGAPRHELLGTRSLDWNPHVATWRNIIRLREVPWLEHHKVSGNVIFPGTAMVSMAVTAVDQLSGSETPFEHIQLRDVDFLRAMEFSNDDHTLEIQFTLSTENSTPSKPSWSRFRLFAMVEGSYIECCRGLAKGFESLETLYTSLEVAGFAENGSSKRWIDIVDQACTAPCRDPYDTLKQSGSKIQYGLAFQNVEGMRIGNNGEAIAQIDTQSWKRSSPDCESPFLAAHPTSLDGLAQLPVPALLGQCHGQLPTMVPVHVANIWLDTRTTYESKILAAAQCRLRTRLGASADVVATVSGCEAPVVVLQGLETVFIESSTSSSSKMEDLARRELCMRLVWKPDIDLLSNKMLHSYCVQNRPAEPSDMRSQTESLELLIMCFIEETLTTLATTNAEIAIDHLRKYVEWMKYQQRRAMSGEMGLDMVRLMDVSSNSSIRADLVSNLESSGIQTSFFVKIGTNLIDVLLGILDPLELMFGSDLVDCFYEYMLAENFHIYPMLECLDLLCHKNPSMKILEIGAGTGGQTLRILQKLASGNVRKWAQYDYTDISPSFFDRAKGKFQDHSHYMNFRLCDISQDPVTQSFEPGSYDLILAGHVLHATKDIHQSLKNIRKLLKPTGRLIFSEVTQPESVFISFAFGLLQGWWDPLKHEERSYLSPCVTTDLWDRYLKETGFTGVDIEFAVQQDPKYQYNSTLVSSAVLERPDDPLSQIEVAIIGDSSNQAQNTLAKYLKARIPGIHFYTLSELARLSLPSHVIVVFVLEVNDFFLDDVSELDYSYLKSALLTYRTTLWVSKSSSTVSQPQHQLVTGLGRSLSSEDATRKFVTLTLDESREHLESASDTICMILDHIWRSPVEEVENNYEMTKHGPKICRIAEYTSMNTKVLKTNYVYHLEQSSLGPESRFEIIKTTKSPADIPMLQFQDAEVSDTCNHSADIEVEVRAIGFTHKDALLLSGQLEADEAGSTLTECAGIVITAGASSNFKPGDRVCLLTTTPIGTHVTDSDHAAVLIPDRLDFVEAVTFPIGLWLSYHTLKTLSRFEVGETVLIHGAGSTFGQIVIQYATKVGLSVLATVSSPSQRETMAVRLGLRDDQVFESQDPLLLSKIRAATGGRGVDIVIGSLSYDIGPSLTTCLSSCGRLIDIGLCTTANSNFILSQHAESVNTMSAKVCMTKFFVEKPQLAYKTFQKVMKQGFDMQLHAPASIHVFGAAQLREAVAHLLEPTNTGKRVIELNTGTSVQVNMKTKPSYQFCPEATYLIAGGLGGLGRSIARWMVKRGAKNLALLSRSGPKSQAAKALVQELEEQGVVCATPSTDVSKLDELQKTLKTLNESGMPPVRGCVQATVALRDNLFVNMSYDDWSVSTSSKVTGSWNLHKALEHQDLDFFVLLSSVGGIYGAPAQANYAAGNTFKDALARHRVSLGLKAVSIDLGFMVDEGVVAESEFLTNSMRRLGILMEITTSEFLALLDHYCDPDLPLLSEPDSQILTGLELPAIFTARGFDVHHALQRPIARHLFHMQAGNTAQSQTQARAAINRASQLSKATTSSAATALVEQWLLAKLAAVLGLPETELDVAKPVHAYGIDSLVAIDLKNWIQKEIGAEVTVFELLGSLPLSGLAALAVERSRHREGP